MTSGTYYIVVQGVSFSWMRTFTIIAGPQTTITATPTAIFNVTGTPSTTLNVTITDISLTTLMPSTFYTTIPSTTITKTTTITPSRVTITTTSLTIRSKAGTTLYSNILTTTTELLSCPTQNPKKDPICTLSLKRTSAGTTSANSTVSAGSHNGRIMHRPRVPDMMKARHVQGVDSWRREALVKRTAGKSCRVERREDG